MMANFKPMKQEVKKVPEQKIPEEFKILDQVKIKIRAKLGTSHLLVRDLLNLGKDSIIQLDRLAGDSADILVNGVPIARGEVIMIGQSFGIRITEFLSVKK